VNINQVISFVELFLEPAAVIAPSGELLAVNRPAAVLLQADNDTIAGRPLVTWIATGQARVTYFLQACLSAQQPVADSLPLQNAEQTIPCWCYGQNITLNGTVVILLRFIRQTAEQNPAPPDSQRLLELFQASTRQRLLDARLRVSEAHAQAVLDTVVDAIITIDIHGIIQTFNPASENMFGYRPWEIIGRNVSFLMPQPHRRQHDAYLHNYLTTGHKKIIGIGREIVAQRKNGEIFPIELAVSEVNLDGQHRFTGVIRDISERKQAEQRLREQELEVQQARDRLAHVNRIDTLGEMAAGIAHEVNQPLTAIASYARACGRWLEAGKTDHPRLLETLNEINEQAQQAGDIIHGLRNLVKKRENRREPSELNQLITETVRLANVDAHQHGLGIVTRPADKALRVLADTVQIQQVLLNMIRNAIEALLEQKPETAGEQGIITVTTRYDDDFARVEIHDQGPGLSSAARDNLFNPFFTTKTSGMGMGLSICRSIVSAHSGHIGFLSEPGQGTTLFFTLPLTLDPE
jgi:two-component system sensor kinase FixL